jgi:hypothetical protein
MRIRNVNQLLPSNEFHDSAEYEQIMRETDAKIEILIEKAAELRKLWKSMKCGILSKKTGKRL